MILILTAFVLRKGNMLVALYGGAEMFILEFERDMNVALVLMLRKLGLLELRSAKPEDVLELVP